MKTDELIRALASDTMPARPLAKALALGLIPALVLSAIGLIWTLGVRQDLGSAILNPMSLMRFVLTGALFVVSLRLALLLARPEAVPLVRLWPLSVIAATAAGLVASALVSTPSSSWQMAMTGKTMTTCLVAIPILSVLPVSAVLFVLRHGASTAPALAGAAAGLAGGAGAAAIYAMYCTEDSPIFYVTWYGCAILGVTALSSLIGAKLLRW
jgi:hypothetical protein